MVDVHFLLHATSRQILLVCGCGAHLRSTGILGKTGKTWLIGLLAGAAAYALAGFLIAPRAIKLWIESPNVSGPTCRLRVQQVYVNPFTMFLSLEDVTLFDQENKLLVSATRAETNVWTVEMLQAETRGRDVVIRNLVVTSADSDEPMLAAPRVSARGVTVDAGAAFIDAAGVRLERIDATIARDAAGIRHRPAWLSITADERTRACISLAGFEALGGRLRLRDDVIVPSVQLELRNIVAQSRRKAGPVAASTVFDVEGHIGAAGAISIQAELGGSEGHHPDLFSMTARNVDLQPLSPYLHRVFGRQIVAGSVDASLRQHRIDATLRIDNHLLVAGLRLGEADAAAALPLELGLALATDTSDRAEFTIQQLASDSQAASVGGVFADSLAAHLDDLAAKPFGVLAELAGAPDAVLDDIVFLPGSAEIAPFTTDTLALLARALQQRPLLGIRVRPAYDVAADRNGVAAQQVRLHIALATSEVAGDDGNATSPDFDDPKVRDILDEFADARLSDAQRRALIRDDSDETTTYRDIYLTLVANEPVSATVLRRLARFRARSVVDALERRGIDRKRVRIADTLDTTTTDTGTVSLKVEVEARFGAHDPGEHERELGKGGT